MAWLSPHAGEDYRPEVAAMHILKIFAGTLGAGLLALSAGAAGACSLQTVGELKVDLSRRAPIVDGEINGVKVKMLIDTGSTSSLIAGPAAKALGLTAGETPGGYTFGIGGKRTTYSTVPSSLKIGTLTASDIPPIMVGGALAGEPDVAMLVGDDLLAQFDIELDFADNMIRLFHADGCTPPQLVYWNKPYSQAALAPGSTFDTVVSLNGKRVLALIDTGSSASLVDAATAAGAGESSPARPQFVVTGLGPAAREAWTDSFDSLAIGDESIAHARIDVSAFARDFDVSETGTRLGVHEGMTTMLIGDDFLHAHRVMIDQRNHVMVFSYVGGPIFSAIASARP
jgi:predicted aspartyl protease